MRDSRDPDQLKKDAEEKLKGGFFKCLAGTQRFEDACEKFELAANLYKTTKSYQEAAECFLKCADSIGKVQDSAFKEADYYEKAAGMYQKIELTEEARKNYLQAIEIYQLCGTGGNWKKCGDLYVLLAKIYEDGKLDHAQTLKFYKDAVDAYDNDDNAKSKRRECNLKVAEYQSLTGEPKAIEKAIEIFESEGKIDLKNSLTKYGAKELFLKAGILYLAMGDSVTVNIKVEEYNGIDVAFPNSREGQLFQNLAYALQTHDVELFEDKLEEYDQITPLDAWKIDFLLKAKATIQPGSGGNGLSLEDNELDLT